MTRGLWIVDSVDDKTFGRGAVNKNVTDERAWGLRCTRLKDTGERR